MLRTVAVGVISGAFAAAGVLLVQGRLFHLVPGGMSYAELAATL